MYTPGKPTTPEHYPALWIWSRAYFPRAHQQMPSSLKASSVLVPRILFAAIVAKAGRTESLVNELPQAEVPQLQVVMHQPTRAIHH